MSTTNTPDQPSSRLRTVFLVLSGLAVAVLLVEVALVFVFRFRWQPAINLIRRINRSVLNPVMNRFAGSEHWYASAIHHVGRTSGKEYMTPVWAIKVGRIFYVPLAYGETSDWCRNLMTSGDGILDFHGERFIVYNPTIIDAEEAGGAIPWRDSVRFGIYGVDSYLRLETKTDHLIMAS